MSRISKYVGIKNGLAVGRAGRMEEWGVAAYMEFSLAGGGGRRGWNMKMF